MTKGKTKKGMGRREKALAGTCGDSTMTRAEVAVCLGLSVDNSRLDLLVNQRKLHKVSYGCYDKQSVEAFVEALAKERDDLRRDTMTRAEVAACLGLVVKNPQIDLFVIQGKMHRVSLGRYDRQSVETLAKARKQVLADKRRDTMTFHEAVCWLDMSKTRFYSLVKQGKLLKLSRGRYDRKSVEAIADTGTT